jgi:hypothetical protein
MTEPVQDGKISFPNRDGIGRVTVSRSDLHGEVPSLDTSSKPEQSDLPSQAQTVEGKDGQIYVLIDRGDGFVFRVPIPSPGESAEE